MIEVFPGIDVGEKRRRGRNSDDPELTVAHQTPGAILSIETLQGLKTGAVKGRWRSLLFRSARMRDVDARSPTQRIGKITKRGRLDERHVRHAQDHRFGPELHRHGDPDRNRMTESTPLVLVDGDNEAVAQAFANTAMICRTDRDLREAVQPGRHARCMFHEKLAIEVLQKLVLPAKSTGQPRRKEDDGRFFQGDAHDAV
ncbi:MAG: hypothetical protein SGJ21_03335 [Alphaproteobacteria bacterium]|nr:hypothetical protein [Alphaproteobacteria bacterium]